MILIVFGVVTVSNAGEKPYRIGIDGEPKYRSKEKNFHVAKEITQPLPAAKHVDKVVIPPVKKRQFVYDSNQYGRWYLGWYSADGREFIYTYTEVNALSDFRSLTHVNNKFYNQSQKTVPVRRFQP